MEKFQSLEEMQTMIGAMDRAELRAVEVSSETQQPYVAIWNTTKNLLEVVVKRQNSNLIQHHEAFLPFVEALREKGVSVKGNVKNYGGEVVLEVLFDNLFVGDGDSKINLGVRLQNSYNHKGYPHFRGEAFGYREICSNGMILGKVMVAHFFSKHTKVSDLQKKMLEFVGQVSDGTTELKEVLAEADKEDIDDEDEAKEILLGEFRSKKTVKKIVELFEKRNLTRYTMYNAITEYATFQARDEDQRFRIHQIAQKVLVTPKSGLRREEWEDNERED